MENAPIGNVGFFVERSLGPTKPLMNAPLLFCKKVEPIIDATEKRSFDFKNSVFIVG